MNAEHIEKWTFGRAAAAEIVGIDEMTLGNWITRYNPVPHRRSGRGTSQYFDLSDIMLFAGINALVNIGIKPEQASDAMSIYGGIYGSLLHNGRQGTYYPGVMSLTRNDEGRWVGANGPGFTVCVELRAWPIFDELWPRFEASILKNPGTAASEDVQAALKDFASKIEQIRKQRWN